jgi:hypothetical protein
LYVIQGNVGSQLTALDTTLDGFCRDLEALDNMSSRTCDTVHVFYVRAGQKTAEEILSNVVSYSVILFDYNTGILVQSLSRAFITAWSL